MSSPPQDAERYEPGLGSQAGFAYDNIRAAILCGHHMPNKKLKVHELALRMGVSPGAVREALFRLVSETLVETREHRGFAVRPVSIADLLELTDLRCEVERIACRRSIERGGVEWESALVAAQYKLRVTAGHYVNTGEISLEYLSAHAEFHEALCAAAGNTRLLTVRAQLYEQYQRFRAFVSHCEGSLHLAEGHDKLAELALARDADGLVREIVEHVSSTAERIAKAIESL